MLFDTRRTLGRRRATAGLDHGSLALARRAAPFSFLFDSPLDATPRVEQPTGRVGPDPPVPKEWAFYFHERVS